MTDFQKELLKSLAENNLNISDTARHMFIHRNTVVYHINQIRGKTRLNPKNFWDLVKLLKAADISPGKKNLTDRYTERVEYGGILRVCRYPGNQYGDLSCLNCIRKTQCDSDLINQLANYEDTGYTPKEIVAILGDVCNEIDD